MIGKALIVRSALSPAVYSSREVVNLYADGKYSLDIITDRLVPATSAFLSKRMMGINHA